MKSNLERKCTALFDNKLGLLCGFGSNNIFVIIYLASSIAIGGYQILIFFINKKYLVIDIIVIIIKIILDLCGSNL